MANPFIISLIILLLTSFSATAESMDDLEFRKGVYYKNFSDVPFTGEVTGDWNGRLKNGKPEGAWVLSDDNGVYAEGNYRDGQQTGLWTEYTEQGTVWSRGSYESGKMDGLWLFYWGPGNLESRGHYKNGEKVGFWLRYHFDGQLAERGKYVNGQRNGYWQFWDLDGKPRSWSGNYKNGEKVGD